MQIKRDAKTALEQTTFKVGEEMQREWESPSVKPKQCEDDSDSKTRVKGKEEQQGAVWTAAVQVKAFQTEGTASTNLLRREPAWHG